MTLKIVSIALSSALLFSCTMVKNPFAIPDDHDAQPVPQMAGPRSVNVNLLDDRLRALTDEAQSIETKMAVLLSRLNDLRDEIQGYDQTMTQAYKPEIASQPPQTIIPVQNYSKPEKTAAAAKKLSPKKVKPRPQETSKPQTPLAKGQGVVNVRTGVHKNKTRLVLDIRGSTRHSMNFDREAGIVTLAMPQTKWSTASSRTLSLNQISGYQAKHSGAGTILALAVENTSDVKGMTLSNPNRIVLDMMK